jgi:putative transposase
MRTLPQPVYDTATIKPAYQLHYHFAWHTRAKRPHFGDANVRLGLNEALSSIAVEHNFRILEHQWQPTNLRALLSLQPQVCASEVARIVKGRLAAMARDRWRLSSLWSHSWFVRSVGRVTGDTIRHYVASQLQRHMGIDARDSKAAYHSLGDPSQIRSSQHAKFEYNVHLVFVVERRLELLDAEIRQVLLDYLLHVCETKSWLPWDVEVVSDHTHLFLGLQPPDAPQQVALSLMNNLAWLFESRWRPLLRDSGVRGLWQPGYYAGTAGAATTAQVKAFLRRDDEPRSKTNR